MPDRRRMPPHEARSRPGARDIGAGRRHQFSPSGAPHGSAPAGRRYRRAYDGASEPVVERRSPEGPRRRQRSVLEGFRRTPLRDGLIGLAMVGAATPLAMSRLGGLRTDPSHEQTVAAATGVKPLSDAVVGNAWRAAAEGIDAGKTTARDTMIADKVERYSELGLDRELAESIYDIALESDIDPDMAFGLVRTESEFKPTAKSHVGAIGLTQLMPATARWMKPGVTVSDLHQPDVNLRIGFKYLRELIDKYDGNERMALLAYNRGPGTVDRVLERGGDPDNGYAEAVITGEGVH